MDTQLALKIAVYSLAKPDRAGSVAIHQMDLSDDGEINWPDGFLAEPLDAEKAIRMVRAARRRTEASR